MLNLKVQKSSKFCKHLIRVLIPAQRLTPETYHPTHSMTTPPPDQVIKTEVKNILIRHFYKYAEDKLRPKRAAPECLIPEHGGKQLRPSASDLFS